MQFLFSPTFPNTYQGTLGTPSLCKDYCVGILMENGGIQDKEDLSYELQYKIAKSNILKLAIQQSLSDSLYLCELNNFLTHSDNTFS